MTETTANEEEVKVEANADKPEAGKKKTKEEAPENESLDFVVYTDGGARPSRGRAGYGFHGYLYRPEVPKQGSGARATPTQEGYLEGKHPNKAVEVVEYVDSWSSVEEDATNNAVELLACIEALEYADQKLVKSVYILADSKYVIDGLNEWVAGWVANEWKKSNGEEVTNRKLWERLLLARGALEQKWVTVKIDHVYGHKGDLGNTLADIMATRGVMLAQKNRVKKHLIESPAKGYWNIKAEHNRMLAKSCWYFNTNATGGLQTQDGRHIYHLGKHGDNDNMLGKRMSDASFSVVYLKEPEKPLEVLREFQDSITDGVANHVIIGALDAIQQPKHYQDLLQYGDDHLGVSTRAKDRSIENSEEVILTKERRPARLAFRAVDALIQLESLLEDFVFDRENAAIPLTVTDITDQLFDLEENAKGKVKCKLKSHIDTSTRSVQATVNYDTLAAQGSVDTTLVLDMDLPSRNALSALAERKPKVYVITWRESDQGFRIATVMEAGDDVGIWSSVYSNLKLIGPEK